MKKAGKIAKWSIIPIFGLYAFIIIFPHFLFANKFEYKHFTVFYHHGATDNEQLKVILDKSEILLRQSEIFREETKQKIFLCNGFSEFGFFALSARNAFGSNFPVTQNVFLSKSDVSANKIWRNGNDNNERSLSSVIAHETTHSLLENELGVIKYRLLPSWKNEGYCDFVANESSYNYTKGIQDFCNSTTIGASQAFKYFKARLYTDFLLNDEKVTFEEFLNNDFDRNELDQKLQEKYCN